MSGSPSATAGFAPGSSVTIRAEADDPDGGIRFVEFYLDDVLLTTKPKEPYEMTYELDLEPGDHVIRAVAEDLAKNTTEDGVTIRVEE